MSNSSLCWWLNADQIAQIDKDAANVKEVISKDDKYVQITKQLTADADTYFPKSSRGWRGTDIDVVESPQTDPRVVNVVAARMKPLSSSGGVDTSKMTDSEIAANILPQGMDFADVHAFVTQTLANRDAFVQAVKDADAAAAKAGDAAATAAAAVVESQPIVTVPPKTE
jgi:hypothetical protein